MTPITDNSGTEIEARYRRAQRFEQAAVDPKNKVIINDSVTPHWIADSDCFWYVRESLPSSGVVKTFQRVDAETGVNQAAFDHQALSKALAIASGEAVDSGDLPFADIELNRASDQVSFSAFDKRWSYDASSETCEAIAAHSPGWTLSPEGNQAIFIRDNNLWLHDLTTGKEKALTHDGERFYAYASTPTVYGRQEGITLEALWSSDSKRIFTLVKDTRQVRVGPPLVRHVPPAGDIVPDIVDPDRRVACPGDEHVEGYYFLSIDVETGEQTNADYRLSPVFFPPYIGFFSGGRGWWAPDNRRAYFIDLERSGLTARLMEFDTHTGATRVLIEETSDARFNFIPMAHLGVILTPLPGGKEVVWYSERSGWAHLYLYDLDTGTLKNAITQGDWLVRNILHYDTERRELFIQTAGRVAGRNPYYRDICRVNIDTGELVPVLSTDHEYFVCDPQDRGFRGTRGVSPSGQYIVTTRSQVNEIPVSVLLDRNGKAVLELEVADVSGLPEGWHWPEPVALKAADGKTDIYGVVFRPSDFSPYKSYPILDFSSSGDYIPAGSFGNSYSPWSSYLTPAAYAELGFIVVMIRCRGTGLRSMAFQADKDSPYLYAYHQDDCIAGIQQLAARHSYMDSDRVGVGGYASPPSVISGLFKYPDFYKVGVSCNPFSDIRFAWSTFGETFCDGDKSLEAWEPYYEDLVSHLKGKLLLIHGMLDNCIPVAATFRIVEALQLANKDFDMLILPNLGHAGISRYVMRRTWDYFVKNLQDINPPDEFELPDSLELDDPSIYSYKKTC